MRDSALIMDNQVLTYGTEEKFLIFSESQATLAFIGEAFDLCRIKYLSFSGQHNREERQSMITTFETSDLYRVLLLELKYGARGLWVTCWRAFVGHS